MALVWEGREGVHFGILKLALCNCSDVNLFMILCEIISGPNWCLLGITVQSYSVTRKDII